MKMRLLYLAGLNILVVLFAFTGFNADGVLERNKTTRHVLAESVTPNTESLNGREIKDEFKFIEFYQS